jgi:hypothetical protein
MLPKTLSLASMLFVLGACSAANEPLERTPSEGHLGEQAEEVHGENFTYFMVTRQDYRKCMYPICGGYYVKQVNNHFMRCADGSWQKECHMVDLDLSALGVSDELASKFENEIFGWGHGLVRGKLARVGQANTLIASEAWLGAAESDPIGTFYRVTDSGIQCVTHPCPSFKEAKLNGYAAHTIHGVDLWVPGASDSEVGLGYDRMTQKGGTLVSGYHYKFWGPAGAGKALVASEFYVPIAALESKYCATTTIGESSPVFYAKNFESEKSAWDWLSSSFPHGENTQLIEGPCDQPRACIMIYKPVCGVIKDSAPETYSNSCGFEAAIMSDAGSDGESKGFYSEGECGPKCDYEDPSKKWVAQSSEQCMLVKFFCEPGSTPFFSECGCGCEPEQS